VDELVGAGAHAADSPGQVAAQSDVVITMLTDPPAVAEVIGGVGGVLAHTRRGMLVMDMSTSSPALARTLWERGEYAAERDGGLLSALAGRGTPNGAGRSARQRARGKLQRRAGSELTAAVKAPKVVYNSTDSSRAPDTIRHSS